ncbi:hypothetical protein GCM10007874_40990 [Labrys miyagiensis]|uniref:Uncharacterized protein n=1 Tax=Labrys miyagiensis TaxID=346912 RepID=A0ABQ6CN69_9HYPH|nr:hypothetical protein [Labrys miyagiensis]GLS21082.1 hypothetical protein GCM10007874_40990 [Labrys miyagiensis]
MPKRIALILALLITAGMTACAPHPQITSETVVIAGLGPVEVERIDVTVAAVNPGNRTVIVEQGAYKWLVDVPPIFGDLHQIRAGDRLQIRRADGAVLNMRRARRGERPGVAYTETVSEPRFQNLPDKYVAHSVTLTAKFESFDPSSGIVHYVGPAGYNSLRVMDPAIQADLGTLRKGDMVSLTFGEAYHILKE